MNIDPKLIEEVRASSRTVVRELGFMRNTLAATDHPPSAVHTLLELDRFELITTAQLVQTLGLEKSSVSRITSKLIEAGEIEAVVGNPDGRVKQFVLTDKGKIAVQRINKYGQMQVKTAFQHLTLSQQQSVVQGLSVYAQALQLCHQENIEPIRDPIKIQSGYQPTVVGRMTEMHANFYSKHSNFGQFFESQVATGVAEFVGRLDNSCNQVWVAVQGDKIVGSIVIDGEDLQNGEAHLRWFILDDGCRGSGVGRKLLAEAINFCNQQNFSAIQLWTFKGLEAARKLYESFGFTLIHEAKGDQWGDYVIEQQFTKILDNGKN